MKILVTGGAGFIGSHVVDEYIDEGHEVIVLDDLSTGKIENVNKRANFHKIDIRDKGKVEKLFQEERFELVNHHAAQIDVRGSVRDPEFDASVNILGTLNLLQSCIKYRVNRFIFISSGGVIYGEPNIEELPLSEEAPKRPISPYGVSKLAIEHYLYYYKVNYGLNYIVLRYGNVYGPRQDPRGEAGVIAIFSGKMLRGEQPTIFGDGEQRRDYIYIEDVLQANRLATDKLGALNANVNVRSIDDLAFNIGTGKGTSVNALFTALKEILHFKGSPNYGAPRAGEIRNNVLAIEKAQRLLGYQLKYTLREGLEETIEWMENTNL